MKLVTRVLIMAIAFFVSASVIDAQDKGEGSIGGKDKPKAKQETKSKLKSSTVKAKTVKGKTVKGKTGKGKKGNYQSGVVINPKEVKYKNGQAFDTDAELKTCLDNQKSKASWYQKRFGFGKSFDKWQKGQSLTSLDKKRILKEASKCEKSGAKKTDIPQPSKPKKGQPSKGKPGKGASKGKVG